MPGLPIRIPVRRKCVGRTKNLRKKKNIFREISFDGKNSTPHPSILERPFLCDYFSVEEIKKTKFFGIILNSVADGVFTVNRENKITYMNEAAERITGYTRKEALGRNCYDIFRADICLTRCALKESIRTKSQIVNLPVTILNKEGKEIPISISTAVLKNERGQMIGGVETFRDLSIIEALRKELSQRYSLEDIISKNHRIQEIFNILPDIAKSDSTVLLQGASGTGKELFAKAIHNLSQRKTYPFIKVNCGAIPETLLESELFGYVKGAFTDAKKDKAGRFALAERGTLFLDEVGDMPAPLQVKLLRVLQEKEFEPLGSTKAVRGDVRIVAATKQDLGKLVRAGTFRDDLYYRLNVVRIELPPLSERKDDIPLLINAFIEKFNARMGKHVIGVSNKALRFLLEYDYPGNIRELENIIEHAFVLCKDDLIRLDCLPREITGMQREKEETQSAKKGESPLAEAEARLIKTVLERNKGNRMKTAAELAISRVSLWRKMKRHGFNQPSNEEGEKSWR
jgi:PAS domain S-box-containing protein